MFRRTDIDKIPVLSSICRMFDKTFRKGTTNSPGIIMIE